MCGSRLSWSVSRFAPSANRPVMMQSPAKPVKSMSTPQGSDVVRRPATPRTSGVGRDQPLVADGATHRPSCGAVCRVGVGCGPVRWRSSPCRNDPDSRGMTCCRGAPAAISAARPRQDSSMSCLTHPESRRERPSDRPDLDRPLRDRCVRAPDTTSGCRLEPRTRDASSRPRRIRHPSVGLAASDVSVGAIVEGFDGGLVELNGPIVVGDRAHRGHSMPSVSQPPVVVRRGERRLARDGGIRVDQCLPGIAQFEMGAGSRAIRTRIDRIEHDRSVKVGERLPRHPVAQVCDSALTEREGIVRIDP